MSHLNPVSVSAYAEPVPRARSCPSSDDETIVVANVPAGGCRAQQVDREQPPTSSPRSIRHAPSARVHRDRDGASVGVGVVRDHKVGVDRDSPAPNAASIAPGSSGFGNATVGKSGSGLDWLATSAGAAKPARLIARATTAPRRRAGGCRRSAGRAGAAVEHAAPRGRGSVGDAPRRPAPVVRDRDRAQRSNRVDRGRDLRVGWRHDLATCRGRPCSRCPAAGCATR